MNYFYSASVMGYGNGRWWHKHYNFPDFPRVTKTLTLKKKIGSPFAIIKSGNTVWNKVGLHNIGFHNWIDKYYVEFSCDFQQKITISIAGTDDEIAEMVEFINLLGCKGSIELNFSCPNVSDYKNKVIPESKVPIYVKLNYKQDPYSFDLDRVKGIRLNSVPKYMGGISGFGAKKYNWPKIKQWVKEGLPVAGCSCTSILDFAVLEDMGCKEIGIGSLILIDPKLVEKLSYAV